jgi:hypothetical protein
MGLASEYEKILGYLENSKLKKTAASPPKIKKEKPKPKKTNTVIGSDKIEVRKQEDVSAIDAFKDLHPTKARMGSDGFSVQEFESLMRSKLIEEYKTRQSYERPYISCTELYNCLRQSYYSRKKYQIDIKSQFRFSYLYLIQKVGNTIHDIFQSLYNFSEVEKTIVSEFYKVKGRVDAISGKYIYEIKSIDDDKFKGTYIKEHYFQGLIYAFILINDYGYDIKKITIIYVSRNLKKVYSFDLDVDLKLAKSFLERAPVLLTAIEANVPPECIGATETLCRWVFL